MGRFDYRKPEVESLLVKPRVVLIIGNSKSNHLGLTSCANKGLGLG